MILTTNRVKDIDGAVQSRISVALHYGPLGPGHDKHDMGKLLEEGGDNQDT